MPPKTAPRSHLLIAAILVAVFMAQSFFASRLKSPVFDEPPHIASGLSYLETHVFHGNLQHPPLLKEISAVFLSLAGIHWPKEPLADALIHGGPGSEGLEWRIGYDIITKKGANRVMFWARMPFILLGGLLGFLIYWWGRELVGPGAALAALFFYTFDPTVIAHSGWVTTDVGITVFAIVFLFALWRYIERPDWRRTVFAGLALGAVLGAKFSAVFFLPIAVMLLAAAARWPLKQAEEEKAEVPAQPRITKAAPNSPCPCGSGKKYKKCHGAEGPATTAHQGVHRALVRKNLITYAIAFAVMFAVAAVFIEALYFFPSDPLLYIKGLRKVNADHLVGYPVYLHGQVAEPRFYSYFLETWLVKEPLVAIGLALAGLFLLLRDRSVPVLKKAFLLLTPVVFFLATTFLADNMGVRYLIPILPFSYLLGGLALTKVLAQPKWGRYAAAAACLWAVIAAVGIFPDHLSYFNEAACLLESPGQIGMDGGSRCGIEWLDDSNIDWGQGLKELRLWMNAHGNGRTLRLAYFGSYPPNGYGLKYENLDVQALLPEPAPGLYAVSAHFVARVPVLGATLAGGAGEWLRRIQPVAVVNHAFYIYDVK